MASISAFKVTLSLQCVFLIEHNWICKYFDSCKIILFSSERLNLRAVSEYKYLVQSDCTLIDGVNDANNFHQLMVYHLTVSLVYNKLFNFVFDLPRSHVISPLWRLQFPRKRWILFKFVKKIKRWSLRCSLQYYGWEIYHSK